MEIENSSKIHKAKKQKKILVDEDEEEEQIFTPKKKQKNFLQHKKSVEDQEESNQYPLYNADKEEVDEEEGEIEEEDGDEDPEPIEGDKVEITVNELLDVLEVLAIVEIDVKKFKRESLEQYLNIMDHFFTNIDPFSDVNKFITENIIKVKYEEVVNQNPPGIADTLVKKLQIPITNLHFRINSSDDFNWRSDDQQIKEHNQMIIQKMANLKVAITSIIDSYYNWFCLLWNQKKGKFQPIAKCLLTNSNWYPWVDPKIEISWEDEFRAYVLNQAQSKQLVKYRDMYYCPIYVNGFLTYSFAPNCSIATFVNEHCCANYFNTKFQSQKGEKFGKIQNVIKSLETLADIQTPNLELTRYLFSFNDGILNIWDGYFLPYEKWQNASFKQLMNFGIGNEFYSNKTENQLPRLRNPEQKYTSEYTILGCFNHIPMDFKSPTHNNLEELKWEDVTSKMLSTYFRSSKMVCSCTKNVLDPIWSFIFCPKRI